MSSEDDSLGYVTDIDYTWGFYSEFAPVHLRWIAASAGYAPRATDQGFTFIELGCGLGASTSMFAACHPEGKFYGIDFNARHIAAGADFAQKGGLTNVEFLARSLTDIDPDELPDADYIVAHGVYSWVNADVREAMHRFIAKKLKPGGILYLSYNSMPGQALVEPVRQWMLEVAANTPGDTEKKVKAAVSALVAFTEKNPRAFGHGDRVKKLVERLKTASVNYVAHEYFNAEWASFYFTDVARTFRPMGLAFAGDARAMRNLPELQVKQGEASELMKERDRVRRRFNLDYLVDESFHRDVWVRAPELIATPDIVQNRTVRATRVGTIRPAADLKREVKVPVGTLRFATPFDDRLIEKIAGQAPLIDALVEDPDLKERGAAGVFRAVHLLLGGGLIRPMAAPLAASAGKGIRLASEFNREILRRHMEGGAVKALASPVAGTGVPISTREALLLFALDSVGEENAVETAYGELERRNHRLIIDNKTLQGKEAHIAELTAEMGRFRSSKLRRFAELGILG